MRKSYGDFEVPSNDNTDFSFNQDGFLRTDLSGTYQYQQPQVYDPNSYNSTSYDPNSYISTSYDPNTFNPSTYNATTYNPTTYNPTNYISPASNQMHAGFPIPNDFMTNAALQYGSTMMEQGSDILQRNMEKYVPTSRLKYYFAVDNMYVAKKLSLLIFPFIHKNWSIQYNHDKQPVPPRYDINAPDLYIPMMAILTYILNCGFMFGIHGQFSPEQLGVMASNAIAWLVVEILVLGFILYIINAKSSLHFMDMVAFSGYKFVGMNIILLSSILFQSYGYYSSLTYFSLALGYFLIRTLKIQIQPSDSMTVTDGNKRRIYLLMITALIQPAVMWMLTKSVIAK